MQKTIYASSSEGISPKSVVGVHLLLYKVRLSAGLSIFLKYNSPSISMGKA